MAERHVIIIEDLNRSHRRTLVLLVNKNRTRQLRALSAKCLDNTNDIRPINLYCVTWSFSGIKNARFVSSAGKIFGFSCRPKLDNQIQNKLGPAPDFIENTRTPRAIRKRYVWMRVCLCYIRMCYVAEHSMLEFSWLFWALMQCPLRLEVGHSSHLWLKTTNWHPKQSARQTGLVNVAHSIFV